MRKPLVAGNWKMNKTNAEAHQLVTELISGLQAVSEVDNVLFPPYTAMANISVLLKDTDIDLGAQNMHWEEKGAYTGEISPFMLVEICDWVIIGHSERRQYFGETDEMINRKIKSALDHSLTPILCVGESLEENEAGRTEDVISRQLIKGLAELDDDGGSRLVIAYEPIWAIGTGRAASPEDANAVHNGVIRRVLASIFRNDLHQEIRILYGGSVKAHNAAAFFDQQGIDGALVGGASLKASEFIAITEAAVP